MTENEAPTTPKQELSTNEILGWVEFGSWMLLALTPMLYVVNGPAVSTDQLVMRSALTILSALVATGLCFRRWRIKCAQRRNGHRRA